MSSIGDYKPRGVTWRPSGSGQGRGVGPQPTRKIPLPPQKMLEIAVAQPITDIKGVPGGVLAAVDSDREFLRAYNSLGRSLWELNILTFTPATPERILSIGQAGRYTWLTAREIRDHDVIFRVFDCADGSILRSTLHVAEDSFPLFSVLPHQGRVALLNEEGLLRLCEPSWRRQKNWFQFDSNLYYGAIAAAKDICVLSVEGIRIGYLLAFGKSGEQIWHTDSIDVQMGRPCQLLIDEPNQQLFVATTAGFLFVVDLTSGKMRPINYPYANNGKLALTIIDEQLYAVIENDSHTKLIAYDLATHKELWHFPPSGPIAGYSLPLGFFYDKSRSLIVTDGDGLMHGLDPKTGLATGFKNLSIGSYQTKTPVAISGDSFIVLFNAPGRDKLAETLAVYKWG